MISCRSRPANTSMRCSRKSGEVTLDASLMARALALAERGRPTTSPNPMVGALVVDDEGVIVGRGAHQFAGGPHAEIYALADAGERTRGATLYCTLEPCSHTGRTGPCAPRVIAAGIRRAVIAMEDPNPLVAGRGLAQLRAHGIDVVVGELRDAAERLNRPFLTRMRRRRPFITMKIALSLDGKIAAAPGQHTWLTGAGAARRTHRDRAEVDALAVGSGTVLVDDPLLTARGAYRARPLIRVVFDRRLRTPPTARLFSTLEQGPVIIVTSAASAHHAADRRQALANRGATIDVVSEQDHRFLEAAMTDLGERGIGSMIVEGGPALHRALWDAGVVDRVQLYVAPRVVGPGGIPWIDLPAASVARLDHVTTSLLGSDFIIEGDVHRDH
jgi:diaminohydroxyphosphoribosylaminopyrimidine deaminase/5-amino-6-(5-phosphoribosylamino)uracil reductase